MDPLATPRHRRLPLAVVLVFACFIPCAPVQAQAVTGTIEGRVQNFGSGEYLEGVRLTVEGTPLETFTDPDGNYRLTNVPIGGVKVRLFYTGLTPRLDSVPVTAGQTARHDVAMVGVGRPPATAGDVVKLDEFVVSTSREMDGAAFAINEQRFAPNIKNVVSTDEFGSVAEGNVADFMKFLPGLTVDHSGGNSRYISLNGVPSDNVPVSVDGFSLASVGGEVGTGRAVQVDLISLNNLSRIEVSHSPTPESPGSALAGSVNMVPRSAFERARPAFNGSVYVMMRDSARDFDKTPGPQKPTRKINPGFDFSYVNPLNKRFGFTLSGGNSTQFSEQDISVNTWRGAGAATNGVAFPHTTPDKPYLTTYEVRNSPKLTQRNSFGVSFDYKLTPNDRISLGFQYSSFEVTFGISNLTFNVNRVLPGDFTTTSTHGAPGAGSLQRNDGVRNRFNRTYMPTLVWRHQGPVWKADAGVGLSRAKDSDGATAFRTAISNRTGVTVRFNDMFYLRPGTITVTDGATGAAVDPYRLDTYSVASATYFPDERSDLQRSAYANVRRNFNGRVPFALKAGLDLRQSERDIRDGAASLTFNGSNRNAAAFLDENFSQRVLPFGFPRAETLSSAKLWSHYQQNPAAFTVNEDARYRSIVSGSKHARELISSAFVRGDLPLLDNRLKIVGGIRAEQTNIEAQGPLNDPTRNILRNSAGVPVVGANGQPLPIATNALEVSRLTFLDRGARTEKEYLRLFPSINASYQLRENLIVRAAHSTSLGRPDFNQYAGGITLPNTEEPPAANNRITVNNPGIKAWSARSTSVRLEYYFEGVGQVSVGAFQRDFENFFGNTVFNATPQFLALHGLDPAVYDAYDVSTQHNIESTVQMTGADINYRQALTFLPGWARGFQVFANATTQRATGNATANFSGYVPRAGNWGISLTREKYSVRTNWNYRGRQRRGEVANGSSIEPGTYNWGSKRLSVDVIGEYYFRKRFAVFANLRNVTDATFDTKIYGPSTPAHANFRQRIDYGSLWTFGVKGTF